MIVADASWVVALRDPADEHHRQAVAIHRGIGSEDVLLHPVTAAECLVAPAQLGTLDDAAAALKAAFEICDVDRDAPLRWAALRAETGLRLPDAIVLETAVRHDARALATFDTQLATAASTHNIETLTAAPEFGAEPEVHAGRFLVENMPRGYDLELPDRRSSRPIPFVDDYG